MVITPSFPPGLRVRGGVPHLIHQVWLGGRPIPPEWDAAAAQWRAMHPDWRYRLWRDADVEALVRADPRLAAYFRSPNPAFRSDIARLAILHAGGGVYADLDFTPWKPLDALCGQCDAFLGATFEGQPLPGITVENAILGAVPGHPFLGACLDGLAANVDCWWESGDVVYMTGPGYLSEKLAAYRQRADSTRSDVFVVPPRFLYPAWPHGVNPDKRPLSTMRPEDYPDALGAHHFGGSWLGLGHGDEP